MWSHDFEMKQMRDSVISKSRKKWSLDLRNIFLQVLRYFSSPPSVLSLFPKSQSEFHIIPTLKTNTYLRYGSTSFNVLESYLRDLRYSTIWPEYATRFWVHPSLWSCGFDFRWVRDVIILILFVLWLSFCFLIPIWNSILP